MKTVNLVGRILFALVFILSFPGHFKAGTVAHAAAAGVPLANVLVPASGILALLGGLSIALGFKARWGGIAIVVFLVPVTLMMHNFWAVSDPAAHQMQMVNFMKNAGLVGGALMFVAHGSGAHSLDSWLARRSLAVDHALHAA